MTNGEKIQKMFPSINFGTLSDDDVICNRDYSCNLEPQFFFNKWWWDSEYKEPTTKNNLGVDCIEKSDAIDIIQDMHGLARADVISDAVNRIITMPSVTPIRPKGHWFIDERPESNRETICSNCEQPIFKYHKLDFDYRPSFCPNCGADMRGNTKRKGEPIEGNNESYNCENWIP